MTFIETYWLDKGICEKIIEWFELQTTHKYDGISGEHEVQPDIKRCTETILSQDPYLFHLYMAELSLIHRHFREKYDYFQRQAVVITENINVQRYFGGEGYFSTHTERDFLSPMRELVFMTYLNDVKPVTKKGCEGGTEFIWQKEKVQAEAGKTLIWPAGYTHMHRGIIHPTDTKYIVTGWFNLTE